MQHTKTEQKAAQVQPAPQPTQQDNKATEETKPKGFTGVVVERTKSTTDQQEEQAPKKVSLFKQRMQQRQQ